MRQVPRPPSRLLLHLTLLSVALSGCLGDEPTPADGGDADVTDTTPLEAPANETTLTLLEKPFTILVPARTYQWDLEIPHNATEITLSVRGNMHLLVGYGFAVGECSVGNSAARVGTGIRDEHTCEAPAPGPTTANLTALAGVASGTATITATLRG